MSRRIWATLAAALMLVVLAGPAGAHEVEGWIKDIEGDANFLNTQGFSGTVGDNPLDPGVSTGGAQVAPADIRAVRFATEFIEVPVGDDGIDYQATGVTVSIVTEETPRSDGPTMMYRLNVNVDGGCNSFLQAYLRGATSLPEDPANGRSEWRQLDAGCPDGATTVGLTDATIDATQNAIVLRLPFEQLTPAQLAILDPGSMLMIPQGSTRTVFTWGTQGVLPYSGLTAPQIDETVIGEDWTVGQDMPEDVPCTLNCPEAEGGQTG
jgi:hypothetical protein